VVITGTNFTGATAVKFGANNATSYTVNSATQITATSPAGAAGTASVQVTTPGGTNAANTLFTYVAPVAAAPIPTVSEWMMLLMASLMAIFGIRRMRRK
jgi:hypothetical protein